MSRTATLWDTLAPLLSGAYVLQAMQMCNAELFVLVLQSQLRTLAMDTGLATLQTLMLRMVWTSQARAYARLGILALMRMARLPAETAVLEW